MKYLFLFIVITVLSCQENKTPSVNKKKNITYLDSKGKAYKYFAEIPDSLRTPEQQKFAKAYTDVLLNYVVVENNHMVLKISKEEFLSKGLSETDFQVFKENIRTNNAWIDSLGIKDVDKMLEKTRLELKSSIK
ncbi:hypothetical protein AAKU52_003364 [Pedobacter sp. CG_S7]|uniref:hypothetical protein n=1 Tax=Pedobacter sp. CG_S7 TaxID=3143930 RepID=UPI0033961EE1